MALLNPYINFNGNAREAMEFYQSVFGGELVMNTYSEFDMAQNPEEGNKIMHAMIESKDGLTFMASDTPNTMEYKKGTDMSISLSGTDENELRDYWDKLSNGGTIVMPFEKAPWGDVFGMVIDKFGVTWMVNVGTPR